MKGKFLFLGTGGSLGVPVVGCTCEVCMSKDPHNQRFRPSGVVEIEGKKFLIDAGPDFRSQALQFKIAHLDGVLLTHCHYDHVGGFDDLRVFSFKKKKKLPILLSQASFNELKVRYHYLMEPQSADKFEFHILKSDFGTVSFQGLRWETMSYVQAGMLVIGYRLGTFAYVSDIRIYSDEVIKALKGVGTLVLSALRYTPTEVHFSLEEAVDFAHRVGAKTTWLTHLAHDLDYETVNRELPKNVRLAYDGLEVSF
jgi:phosphoribosyl 1,2-cyclic phosphate phosphodiesterase